MTVPPDNATAFRLFVFAVAAFVVAFALLTLDTPATNAWAAILFVAGFLAYIVSLAMEGDFG